MYRRHLYTSHVQPNTPPIFRINDLFHDDESRSIESSSCNVSSRSVWSAALDQRTQGQALGESQVEGKLSREGGHITAGSDVRDGDDDREILARDVRDGGVALGDRAGDAELLRAVACRRLGRDRQGREGRQADGLDVGAGSGDDELRDGGVGELGSAAGQERSRGGRLALEGAVESGLLALLADDGTDDGHESCVVTSVRGEDRLGDWEDTKYDRGEGLGESEGVAEVGDREAVLTWLDGLLLGVGEHAVGSKDVNLFLLWRYEQT